jgi:hypothetical protein
MLLSDSFAVAEATNAIFEEMEIRTFEFCLYKSPRILRVLRGVDFAPWIDFCSSFITRIIK